MLEIVKGNIFDTDCEIIAHGVNCIGKFGSGIAGQIAKKYPSVREAYLDKFNRPGWELGDMQVVKVEDKIIINLATQQECAYDGKRYISYRGLTLALLNLSYYGEVHHMNIALPRIGSGLGGGDKEIIQAIIEGIFAEYPYIVKIYDYEEAK